MGAKGGVVSSIVVEGKGWTLLEKVTLEFTNPDEILVFRWTKAWKILRGWMFSKSLRCV